MRRAFLVGLLALCISANAPDAFDNAVAALDRGMRAEARVDRAGLHAAAFALAASGAGPIQGQEDVAQRWQREARIPAAPVDRDRALGPAYRLLNLDPGTAVRFEQTFLAGQRARVAVVPAPKAMFTMRVADQDETVCNASPQHAQCDWVPSFTTRVRIELRNVGVRKERFFLMLQ